MLKTRRSTSGKVLLTLSGRIEMQDVAELQRLLALETVDHPVAMDLRDVTLLGGDVVKYLASCEADGIKLENHPAYIREWMRKEHYAK